MEKASLSLNVSTPADSSYRKRRAEVNALHTIKNFDKYQCLMHISPYCLDGRSGKVNQNPANCGQEKIIRAAAAIHLIRFPYMRSHCGTEQR
jgi:hypothetical protein